MFSSKRTLRWIAVLALSLCSTSVKAGDVAFTNLSLSDFHEVARELAGNFAYSSITPASSLGKVWGFEFGAVAGGTNTPDIATFVKAANSSTKFKRLYHANLLGRFTFPLGITGELMAIPKVTAKDASIKQVGGAAMWTVTDLFFTELPVTIAAKGFVSKTNLSFSQNITGNVPGIGTTTTPATIEYSNVGYGGQVLVSKKLLVFEPYLGFGYVQAKGNLSMITAATTQNVFNFPIPSLSAGVDSSPYSTQLMAGLDVQLLFIALGAEIQRSFGTNSYTGRLSFRF